MFVAIRVNQLYSTKLATFVFKYTEQELTEDGEDECSISFILFMVVILVWNLLFFLSYSLS